MLHRAIWWLALILIGREVVRRSDVKRKSGDERPKSAPEDPGEPVGAKPAASVEIEPAKKDVPENRAVSDSSQTVPSATPKPVSSEDEKSSDLTKIEGVGPKMAGVLEEGGIRSYHALARASVDDLRALLEKANPRYRLQDPSTWPRQAELAARGAWDELAELQKELKGGRKV